MSSFSSMHTLVSSAARLLQGRSARVVQQHHFRCVRWCVAQAASQTRALSFTSRTCSGHSKDDVIVTRLADFTIPTAVSSASKLGVSKAQRLKAASPSEQVAEKIRLLKVALEKRGVSNTAFREEQSAINKKHPLHTMSLKFVAAAATEKSLPTAAKQTTPEFAFAGRSNVGKSSLINSVTVHAPARAADRPGVTQTINFYNLGGVAHIVDLPGYGFAFADEEKHLSWAKLTELYLSKRHNLKLVFLVIDARHGFKQSDLEFLAFLDSKGPKYQVVLTKCDLVRPDALGKQVMLVKEELKLRPKALNEVHMISSATGAGIYEVLQTLNTHITGQPHPVDPRVGTSSNMSLAKSIRLATRRARAPIAGAPSRYTAQPRQQAQQRRAAQGPVAIVKPGATRATVSSTYKVSRRGEPVRPVNTRDRTPKRGGLRR